MIMEPFPSGVHQIRTTKKSIEGIFNNVAVYPVSHDGGKPGFV